MSRSSEKMSNVDTAWWHMEAPTNLMMITCIMVCDGRPDVERLRRTIEARLLAYDRFRQRVSDPGPLRTTRWELDPHFDLGAHVHHVALPAPGDHAALEALVSDLMSMPLDYTKPLWQAHIVEGVGDGFAIVFRLHHCLADGIALMRVLLSLTDDTPEGEELPPPPVRAVSANGGPLRLLMSPVRGAARLATGAAETAVGLANTAVRTGIDVLQEPGLAVDAARSGLEFAERLVQVTVRLPDPPTIYKGELGPQKRAAWSEAALLAEVKVAARGLGGSINDFIVTAFTGALRRYMEDQGVATAGVEFRAYIPVNMRPAHDDKGLGNKFGLVFLKLPIGTVDQQERFAKVKARMDELKQSPEAVVAFTLLNIAGMLPTTVENLAFSIYHAKSTAVLTNVPGPQFPLYMAGSPLRSMMGWVPQAGGLGLGISILSYNGGISLGLNTDAGLVPDPAKIAAYYEDELARLLVLGRGLDLAKSP